MAKTDIEWADDVWNPVRGCSRVSEGCRHCYAERTATRFSGNGQPYEGLVRMRTRAGGKPHAVGWNGEVRFVVERLADPLKWRKPRRIFVNSMSDLFHESLTNEQIAAVFGVMAACPQHTFQILTKRAKRMREWLEWAGDHGSDGARSACRVSASLILGRPIEVPKHGGAWPLPNVWLGVSVENQAAADERIPELLATPASVRFISCEPLLGPINLRRGVFDRDEKISKAMNGPAALNWHQADSVIAHPVDWVIAGCESGPGARPCEVEWLRSLRDQCAATETAFFLKQVKEPPFDDDREDPREVGYPPGPVTPLPPLPITFGEGSHRKPGGIIGAPYLDGVQHLAFPQTKEQA